MYDPLVLDNRNLLMQRILDAEVHGFTYHCAGSVALDRADRFVIRKHEISTRADPKRVKQVADQCILSGG